MTNDCGDLRVRLRAATADSHQRLETALDLLGAPSERLRFIGLLTRFRSFHAAWEPALEACLPDDGEFLRARRKLPIIDADLRALGVDTERSDAESIAKEQALFAASLCVDARTALGSLYVLEGSTLGGKFIARHLAQAAVEWLPPGGLHYFDPYGDATGRRWNETMARLCAVSPAEWPGIEQGAIRTFTGLQQWLTLAAAHEPQATFK